MRFARSEGSSTLPAMSVPFARKLLKSPKKTALLALSLVALVASVEPALRYTRATSLLLNVVRAKDPTGLTELVEEPVVARESSLALAGKRVRTRVYAPANGRPRSYALLLHGVHPRGIDESRLQAFARALAAIGVETVTPQIAELTEQRVLPSTIDDIGALATAISAEHGQPVGAFGISFAGGLLLLAATEPSVGKSLRYVVTVGAHHDLRRVLRYYADDAVRGPDGSGTRVRAHPYGGRVMAAAYAELFFDPSDVELGRRALLDWLDGRYKPARALLPQLSDAGRDRFQIVTQDARHSELNALLLRAARQRESDLLAVSPARGLTALRVPTFLVHGETDPIVPSIETRWLATEVPAQALREALVTPVLRHAELSSPPSNSDNFAIMRFVAGFLAVAD